MADLSGHRALVTGGAVGIGRAVALALARAGADVALTHLAHDAEPVVAEVRALGRTAAAFRLDARRSWDVDRVVVQAAAALGGAIDILVNNVGGLVARRPVETTDDLQWAQVLDLNVSSVFYASRAVLAAMPTGGRIITISSLAGRGGGGTGSVAYATAKAALDGFTRALAHEVGPRGITVNAVAPGFVAGTPFHTGRSPDQAQQAAVAATAVGRAGSPQDVAAAGV